MKTISIILAILLTANMATANDIDSIKTADDVQRFLVEKVSNEWKDNNCFEQYNKDNSTFGKGKFFKIDLDNNGLTDLVINGKYFFAISDDGKGKYLSHFIDRGAFLIAKYTLIDIIYKDKIPLLLVKSYLEYQKSIDSSAKTDTLIFKFGDFIEFNSLTDNLRVEEIKFTTSGCFGSCPIFKISIFSDRSAVYKAIRNNKRKGTFDATIDSVSFNNLIQTINYIKLSTLSNDYSVDWTCDQTVTLEIEYNDGQVKKITDYGAIGTLGLENLYNQLFNLRDTQEWE